MDITGLTPSDRHVDGVVDATQNYDKPLTESRLFDWHVALFTTGRSGMRKITVGAWQNDSDGPMQVVSGPMGRERVHYEAPPANHLPQEMKAFVNWFAQQGDMDLVIKSAIAHLWFITLHPFDDGNGRIARAISDQILARSEQSANRFYNMSSQIREDRNDYYNFLERTQKDGLEITEWIRWYLGCLDRAFDGAEIILGKVMQKANFWQTNQSRKFNARQTDYYMALTEN